jgi:hypothetical protein
MIKSNALEVDAACRKHGSEKTFWLENLIRRECLGDLTVDGRPKLKLTLKKWCNGGEWILLAQQRDYV